MGVSWTPEQQEAIKARNCNLLVSAAAGSGKTAVLVERIIGRVLDKDNPADIDRLLVVTFTKAAASEMRERIGAAFSAKIDQINDNENSGGHQWLKRQLALLNKATITTIHSFCQKVIKLYYQKVGLDPTFTVGDETRTEIIKSEVLDNLLDELYEEKTENKNFTDLLECYGGGRSDDGLKSLILTVSGFINSCPFPEKWLETQTGKFNFSEDDTTMDFGRTEWGRIIIDNFTLTLNNLIQRLQAGIGLAQAEGCEPYGETLSCDMSSISELLEICGRGTWDDMYGALSGFVFNRMGRCKKGADKQIQDMIKAIRDEVKETLDDYKNKVINASSEEVFEDLKGMYPMLSELKNIVLEFNRRYADYKKKKCIIDFNDMEHYALAILSETGEDGSVRPSRAALDYREYFSEVYTDEYQDSNLTQELILSLVSRDVQEVPDMFMVGDIKQSIYGFRHARPDIFLGKYEKYSEAPGSPERLIRLFKNFRSRKDVIGCVNYIFSKIMSKSAGEMDYGPEEFLYYGAGYPGSPSDVSCELMIGDTGTACPEPGEAGDEDVAVPRKGTGEDEAGTGPAGEGPGSPDCPEDARELPGPVQFEAMMVASRIRELVKGKGPEGRPFQVYDKKSGEFRDIRYSDIVILMRSTAKNGQTFAEELFAGEIPVYWDTGSGFFITKEVQIMLSLLQIIDNPYQDIPLLAVMRSPVGGFTEEDLIDIRLLDRKSLFYSIMLEVGANPVADENLKFKVEDFLDRLEKWREDSREKTTGDLICELYEDTGYYDLIGLLPNGESQKANLRMLLDRALEFEKNGSVGIFNFLSYIEKLRVSGDLGSATVLGENDNVVRIMSIHKSKGLEFPVVFLCDCSKAFNRQDQNQKIIFHQELGPGPDYIDPELRIIYSTKAKKAVQLKQESESIAEEMRILYVAMTRAREKLIVSGIMKKTGDRLAGMWTRMEGGRLSPYNALNAGSYFDWILPVLLRHPDMKQMRLLAGLPESSGILEPGEQEECRWNFSCRSVYEIAEELESGSGTSEIKETEDPGDDSVSPFRHFLDVDEPVDEDMKREVARRLEWKYPYSGLSGIPVKLTVSELKRLKENQEEGERLFAYIPALIEKPSFLLDKVSPTAAQKGSATHFVLQNINLDLIRSVMAALLKNAERRSGLADLVRNEIAFLKDRCLMTEEEASWVDPEVVAGFFMSPVGLRLLSSDDVRREVPFTMELGAAEVYDSAAAGLEGEKITIQGIVDCYFAEENGFVLLDYKTDRVKGYELTEAALKYRVQINTYKQAIERGTGIKVKESYIFFLAAKDFVRMDG